MAIKPSFKISDIQKRFEAFANAIEAEQIKSLEMLGEMCVTHAKELPPEIGFGDITANLRSSMGYGIFKDGIAIRYSYEQVKQGEQGVEVGRQLAEDIGRTTEGLALVVTAGMNYAIHVEAKGRDVLTSAELMAKRELPNIIEKLIKNIQNV